MFIEACCSCQPLVPLDRELPGLCSLTFFHLLLGQLLRILSCHASPLPEWTTSFSKKASPEIHALPYDASHGGVRSLLSLRVKSQLLQRDAFFQIGSRSGLSLSMALSLPSSKCSWCSKQLLEVHVIEIIERPRLSLLVTVTERPLPRQRQPRDHNIMKKKLPRRDSGWSSLWSAHLD